LHILTNFSGSQVYLQQSVDDGALVQRSLEGDSAAFERLVDNYQRVLFSVALRLLGNYEDARDATQNAFIKVYQRLDTYDPQYRFFSWIYRILVNECLNAKRAHGVEQPLSDDHRGPDDPGESLETAERKRAVRQAILALPLEYREVIVLRHFAALSYEEMAVAIGIPAKTVKSRLHTARQRLLEALAGLKLP
jgi:RNA polymerase sigma-70 factor, ECF subfamily